jgi:arginase
VSVDSVRILSLPGPGPDELLARHGLRDELERRGFPASVEEISEPLGRRLAARVRAAAEEYAFPLVLAGNSASCLGTVAGLDHERLGVVWFDAHADLDAPDDALALLTGSGRRELRESIPGFRPVDERDVVLVGVRDLEPHQRERLDSSAVNVVAGAPRMGEIAAAVDDLSRRVRDVYLHVDLDVLDAAASGGLPLETLTETITLVGEWLEVRAAAVTAYDPQLDPGGEVARAAVEIAAAAAEAGIKRRS